MACCDHRINVDDLRDAANDPALEDCCRRDLLQQAKSARIAFQLRQHDRTTERTDVAQRVLDTDAAPADPYDMCCERHGTDACCQTSELHQLREQRMRQLRHAAAQQRDAAALQYGVLHQVPETDALALVKLAKLCVCHLQEGSSQAAAAVDQLLQTLAHAHTQTLFMRAPFDIRSPLAQHCRMPGPGLVCLRGSKPIAAGPHEAFAGAGGRLDSEAVVAWLVQAGVLPADGKGSLPQPAAEQQDSEDSEAEDWDEPCTLCGRRYKHEHVQAAAAPAQPDGSDEDSDF